MGELVQRGDAMYMVLDDEQAKWYEDLACKHLLDVLAWRAVRLARRARLDGTATVATERVIRRWRG